MLRLTDLRIENGHVLMPMFLEIATFYQFSSEDLVDGNTELALV